MGGLSCDRNFYPRSPCGERRPDEKRTSILHSFLSTLSLRRATERRHKNTSFHKLFLSTLSLRRATLRVMDGSKSSIISIHALLAESDPPRVIREPATRRFLSTLSLRRATRTLQKVFATRGYFYPRSPCGERREFGYASPRAAAISIHALLAESDAHSAPSPQAVSVFLSTLSLRRATAATRRMIFAAAAFLSTLSLRRATHRPQPGTAGHRISIHALLAESDYINRGPYHIKRHISIHALLAESDLKTP